jgi:hypothetical protein
MQHLGKLFVGELDMLTCETDHIAEAVMIGKWTSVELFESMY